MYCDGCGGQLNVGAQFCSKCGKAIVPSAVGAAGPSSGAGRGVGPAAYGAQAGVYDRVRRNFRILAGLWLITGILRLVGAVCMLVFGTVFLPFLRGGMGPSWPFSGRWGMEIPLLGGLFSVVVFLGVFGALHLVLAWGLFERASWARTLGIVIGFLALLRFPLGTALGVYTLWVMLPQESGAEYARMVRGGGQMNSAAVSG
jgi:hypothetical protein